MIRWSLLLRRRNPLKMQVYKSSDSIIIAREGMTGNIDATTKSES
jgi:hypothetical protein